MTKKDFVALADAMRRAGLSDLNGLISARGIVEALCGFMRAQNGQFKEDRWRAYLAGECGPGGGAVKKEAPKVVREIECPHCGGDGKEPGAPDDLEAGAPQCGVCKGGQYVTHATARKYRQEAR